MRYFFSLSGWICIIIIHTSTSYPVWLVLLILSLARLLPCLTATICLSSSSSCWPSTRSSSMSYGHTCMRTHTHAQCKTNTHKAPTQHANSTGYTLIHAKCNLYKKWNTQSRTAKWLSMEIIIGFKKVKVKPCFNEILWFSSSLQSLISRWNKTCLFDRDQEKCHIIVISQVFPITMKKCSHP